MRRALLVPLLFDMIIPLAGYHGNNPGDCVRLKTEKTNIIRPLETYD